MKKLPRPIYLLYKFPRKTKKWIKKQVGDDCYKIILNERRNYIRQMCSYSGKDKFDEVYRQLCELYTPPFPSETPC